MPSGLRGAAQLMPSELSGGMGRRVALARAIALDPMLVMYDEPFAGLDPISLAVVGQLIRRLNDALGITSIVVTHDVYESLKIVDYLYFVSDGKIVAERHAATKCARPSDPFVRQFVDGAARWAGALPLSGAARTTRSCWPMSSDAIGGVAAGAAAPRRHGDRRGRAAGLHGPLPRRHPLVHADGVSPAAPDGARDLFLRRAVAGDHPDVGAVRRHGAGAARLRGAAALQRAGAARHRGRAVAGQGTRAGDRRSVVREPRRVRRLPPRSG